MRRSTVRWRACAAVDVLRSGLNAVGRCGSAARNAACAGVSIDGSTPKYSSAGAPGAGGLVAVGREVQVEREDLALREAMLEPQREHHLAHLGAEPAALHAVALLDQQLRDLLRDRRAAFDDAAFGEVVASGAKPRHRGRRRDASRSADPRPRSSPPRAPAAATPPRAAARALRWPTAPRTARVPWRSTTIVDERVDAAQQRLRHGPAPQRDEAEHHDAGQRTPYRSHRDRRAVDIHTSTSALSRTLAPPAPQHQHR